MCGSETVDEKTAAMIAATAAAFRQVTASPFGADDQIGMLNLLTPESMRAVLSRADAGHTHDLSVDYFMGMPSFTAAGQPSYQISMTNTPRGTVVDDLAGAGRAENVLVSYSGDAITMYTHCGTHFDTLNHFGYRNKIWNGFDADERLGTRHWTVCGADKQPPIIARGVLLDVAAMHGVDALPPGYAIGRRDLLDAARHQRTRLHAGDVVLVRTGQMSLWPDNAFKENEPGLNREGAEFLARGGAIVIGADNLALEQIPSSEEGNWLPVHTFLLAEAGVPLLEVVDLQQLSAEKVHEFCFIGACIRLRGATGAPLRPLAMPFSSR
jgi:kynurenine formamidase